jgi:hypothetical protein
MRNAFIQAPNPNYNYGWEVKPAKGRDSIEAVIYKKDEVRPVYPYSTLKMWNFSYDNVICGYVGKVLSCTMYVKFNILKFSLIIFCQ